MIPRGTTQADDLHIRRDVLRRLVELREQTGLSQAAVGRVLGITEGAVSLAERTDADPRIDRLQRHARAVRHRLILAPKFDPDLPDDPTTTVFRRMADATTDPEQADMYHRSTVLRHLIARRRWLGLTARQVSARMGRTNSALGQLEQDVKPPLLSSYQRYTRALDGWLRLDLQPL